MFTDFLIHLLSKVACHASSASIEGGNSGDPREDPVTGFFRCKTEKRKLLPGLTKSARLSSKISWRGMGSVYGSGFPAQVSSDRHSFRFSTWEMRVITAPASWDSRRKTKSKNMKTFDQFFFNRAWYILAGVLTLPCWRFIISLIWIGFLQHSLLPKTS